MDLKKYVKKGNNQVKITMCGKVNLFYRAVGSYYLKWTDYMMHQGFHMPFLYQHI